MLQENYWVCTVCVSWESDALFFADDVLFVDNVKIFLVRMETAYNQ